MGIGFLFLIVAAFGARYGMELPQSSRNKEFDIINYKLDLLLRNKINQGDLNG